MSDAYRTITARCPGCADAGLREFNHRLVCDKCGGMMLGLEDFTASLRDLDASTSELMLADGEAATAGCPRCGGTLAHAAATFGKTRFKDEVLHCARDGVWLTSDAMIAAFARVSRAAGPRGASTAPLQGGSGSPGAAMAGIQDAFGGGLIVGARGPRHPRVHTLFVSAYAGQKLPCPSCASAELHAEGDRWACSSCAGAFVETAALAAMVEDLLGKPYAAAPVSGPVGARACPVCKTAMHTEKADGPEVDRCAEHGTWFDAGELGAMLHHVTEPPKTHAGWLRKLFYRSF